MFKILTDCHTKTCQSGELFWKSFGRTYALSVGLKIETSKKKRFPVLRQKLTQILP